MPASFDCPHCKQPFTGAQLVLRVECYASSNGLHICACPHCATSIECRIRSGELEVGYTYWAGSLHFEGVAALPVRGLRVADAAGNLWLDGKPLPWWTRPADGPASG